MRLRRLSLALTLAALPLFILGARKGDVSLDDTVDALDVLLLERALRGDLTLTPEAEDAADVAPLFPVVGDESVDPGDLGVLLRAIAGEDVDGDGLPVWFENQAGTFPFALDSDANGIADQSEDGDQDGLANAGEYANGLDPTNPDTDGDGFLDGVEVSASLDPGVTTSIAEASAFLYTGQDPIQTGVDPATIVPFRAAIVRGKVLAGDGSPLAGVGVAVADHAELGATLTRVDGAFDLVVNGGTSYLFRFERGDLLTSRRRVTVPWRDIVVLPDVVLIPEDSNVKEVDSGPSAPAQFAQGSVVTDPRGTRRPTLIFQPGTTATLHLPGGGTSQPAELHVRATEYTAGADPLAALPADIPVHEGQAWVVDLSADEAEAAGAESVTFDQPVSLYFENFDGRGVGEVFTNGSLVEAEGRFVEEAPGVVLEIVGEAGGLAEIDTDGDGNADGATFLETTFGITTDEREQLAALFDADQQLVRVPISHFSGFCGGHGKPIFPSGAEDPKQPPPNPAPPNPCPTKPGSTIRLEGQCLGERVPLVGSPFALHYESDRTPAAKDRRSIEIPVTGATLPAPLQEVQVEVQVGGIRTIESTLAPTTDYRPIFTWDDGVDAYGRVLQGAQPATVHIRYGYTITFEGGRTGRGYKTQTWRGMIGPFDARGVGLGGWTLSAHHTYDPNGRILYRGDGTTVRAEEIPPVIETLAGGGMGLVSGQPATSENIQQVQAVAIDANGAIFGGGGFTSGVRVVYRVDPDTGVLTFFAGGGLSSADGIPATAVRLVSVSALAFGPDGSLFIANTQGGEARIWRVTPEGIAYHFAGTGVLGYFGENVPATSAQISNVSGLDVTSDGSVYLADTSNARIRKVTPDGIIRTIAGTGSGAYTGPGGPAISSNITTPSDVAVAADGTIYFSSSNTARVLKITPDGILREFAGTGGTGLLGDGGPATSAAVVAPRGLAIGPDGSVYIASELSGHRVRRVTPDGIIQTVAGTGTGEFNGDKRAARGAGVHTPNGIATDSDGNLYLGDKNNHRIRKVGAPLAGFSVGDILVPSSDGSELYVFDEAGRHQETLEPRTMKELLTFGYTPEGKLATVTDANTNVHTVLRDGEGRPTAIRAPFGQETDLALDANGFLRRIENPASEFYDLTYTSDGLLETLATPNGDPFTFEYDTLGRLELDADPEGGSQTLARTSTATGAEVTLTTTLLRQTSVRRERSAVGDKIRTTTDPAGLETVGEDRQDGVRTLSLPSGVEMELTKAPDPRLGLGAPLPGRLEVTTPAGRSFVATFSRTTAPASGEVTSQLDEWQIEKSATEVRTYQSAYEKPPSGPRTVTTTTPELRVIADTVDDQGRLLSRQVGSLEAVSYEYDAKGRIERIRQGSGAEERVTTFSYSLATGLLTGIEDPLLRDLTIDSRDAAGRPTQETLPGPRTVGFGWDGNGNLTSLTPPARPAHQFRYTALDQEREYEPPEATPGEPRITTRTWDVDRALDLVSRPDLTAIDPVYELATGRLASVTLPEGAIALSYYPSTGQIESLSAPGGVGLDLVWDALLLESETWTGPVAGSVSFDYADYGLQLVTERVNGADPVDFGYDDDGLLIQAGALTLTPHSSHGLLESTDLDAVSTQYFYNAFGELDEDVAFLDGIPPTILYRNEYTQRDKLGRILEKVETIGVTSTTWEYGYDDAGRLDTVRKDGVPQADYAYDGNGNRTKEREDLGGDPIALYDAQDRLTSYAGRTYTYSEAGELETMTEGGQATTYAYDPLGSLRSVCIAGTGPSCTGGTLISYEVDALGRRVGKRVNGTLHRGFLWSDGLRVAAELDGTGALVSRFVYGLRPNVPEYMVKGGIQYRILTDHLGSVRLVVNAATGAIAQQIDYDAWGVPTFVTGSADFQPFGFAGGLYDQDTGLVRFGARDYDARTARWASKDPIGFLGGDSGLYSYALSDPVNFRDADGREVDNTEGTTVVLVLGGGDNEWFGSDSGEVRCLPAGEKDEGLHDAVAAPGDKSVFKTPGGTNVSSNPGGGFRAAGPVSGLFIPLLGGGRIPASEVGDHGRAFKDLLDYANELGRYAGLRGKCECRE